MAIIINRIEDYSAIFEICKNKDINLKNIELDFRQNKLVYKKPNGNAHKAN